MLPADCVLKQETFTLRFNLTGKGLNKRSEGSHRPTGRREKIMERFKSPGQAQRFLSVHDQVQTMFRPRRHTLSAAAYRHIRADAHCIWDDITRDLKAAKGLDLRLSMLGGPIT